MCAFSAPCAVARNTREAMWTSWWKWKRGRSLLDLSSFLQDMEELVSCRVHIVESESLHWAIRDPVIEEATPP